MINQSKKDIQETIDTVAALKDAFQSLGSTINTSINYNLLNANNLTKDYARLLKNDVSYTLSALGKQGAILIDNQNKLIKGQLTSKDVEKQIADIENRRSKLAASLNNASKNNLLSQQSSLNLSNKINQATSETVEELELQRKETELIEKRLGMMPNLLKSLNKIPLLGGLGDNKKALIEAQLAAAKGNSVLNASFTSLGKSIAENVLSPAGVAMYILGKGFTADKQITNLAKSLSLTKEQAIGARYELYGMAAASGDAFITTEKLVEATSKLNQQLGIAKIFSSDITVEFTKLTEKIGISEGSAANLAKMSILLGKSSHEISINALSTARALESQAGNLFNEKEILDEVGKVSGQLLANLKANPIAIASAVTQAKLLGTTLEITKRQSESLLDFQSSIEKQLQAQLITGQSLNLERARGAALLGDQETVMKELANQNLNFTKFSSMNVIAQKSIASALGLSADELANQLAQQQFLNKSREEVVKLGGEEVAKRLEALDAQTKFNNAIVKLQDILVTLVDGPIGALLGLAADVLNAPFSLLKGNDVMSGYGNRTLVTTNGSYALNDKDTVIAGTNLFKGNDIYSGPEGAISLGGNNKDIINELRELKTVLLERPAIAQVKVSEFANPITIYQQQNMRYSI